MGGYGSGWHGGDGRPRRRLRVSECKVVVGVEAVRASLVAAKPDALAPDRFSAEVVSMTPPTRIDAVLVPHPRSRIGRLFFVCPWCQRQVARLYQPADGWPLKCRRCYNLAYRSTQESRKPPAGLVRELRHLMGW